MRGNSRFLALLGLALSCVACGGGGGAAPVSTVPPSSTSPPPAKPPLACVGADIFPGFLYMVDSTPTSPAELHISSTDGCSTQFVAALPNLRSSAFHMTADRSAGVIVWSEDIENRYIVRRIDFTVDNSDNLVLEQPVTILPLAGEEALLGDYLFYFSKDIWGDATHDSLYLTTYRIYEINSGPDAGGGTRDLLIYDLNDLTGNLAGPAPDERLLFHLSKIPGAENLYGDWLDADPMNLQDCPTVGYPQFVPTCYRPQGIGFNPSGTRLYIGDNIDDPQGQRWDAALRINIDRVDAMGVKKALAKWTFSAPELVYTGRGRGSSGRIAPTGALSRPDDDVSVLPSPEYVAVIHRDGGSITEVAAILNADQCASDFAPYAGGNLEGLPDLWQGCVDNSTFFTGNLPGRGTSWQSPEALLKSSFQDPETDIHRVYVTGALAGTEQLMIETARSGDTGN